MPDPLALVPPPLWLKCTCHRGTACYLDATGKRRGYACDTVACQLFLCLFNRLSHTSKRSLV